MRQTIGSLLGVHPHVVDGSGLSEADKTSPYQVADLLVGARPDADRRGTARQHGGGRRDRHAGRTHAPHRAPRDDCQGKTGTLTGVSNLVGYCQAADGHMLAFAIFTDGIATETAHVFQDHMTITIADY